MELNTLIDQLNRVCVSERVSATPQSERTLLIFTEQGTNAFYVSHHLSGGKAVPINEYPRGASHFPYVFRDEQCRAVVLPLRGHVKQYEYAPAFSTWKGVYPRELLSEPLRYEEAAGDHDVVAALRCEARRAQTVIGMTDTDADGEAICLDAMQICTEENPSVDLWRAHCRVMDSAAITEAMTTLRRPDDRLSQAVHVRRQLDKRWGAAMTMLMTLSLRAGFPVVIDRLQTIPISVVVTPALGFVVQRDERVRSSQATTAWGLQLTVQENGNETCFQYEKNAFDSADSGDRARRLIQDVKEAVIFEEPTTNRDEVLRPLPPNTLDMIQFGEDEHQWTAAETIRLADHLHRSGYISYPRTESNTFPGDVALDDIVALFVDDPEVGECARQVLSQEGGACPRRGGIMDAKPPIHPVKVKDGSEREGKCWHIYTWAVQRFLACCWANAKVEITTTRAAVGGEQFTSISRTVVEPNYRLVYPYPSWTEIRGPTYTKGQVLKVTNLVIQEEQSHPEKHFTESELLSVMRQHELGATSTRATYVPKLRDTGLVVLRSDGQIVSRPLGRGIVAGLAAVGCDPTTTMTEWRRELNTDLRSICAGTRPAVEVMTVWMEKYKAMYDTVETKMTTIHNAVGSHLGVLPLTGYLGMMKVASRVPPEQRNTPAPTAPQPEPCEASASGGVVGSASGPVEMRPRCFPCPEDDCGKIFKSQDNLEQHLVGVHGSGRSFACPLCPKTYPGIILLGAHCREVHGKYDPESKTYSFECSICQSTHPSLGAFNIHLAGVHPKGEKQFKCTYPKCGRPFATVRRLQRHVSGVHEKHKKTIKCPQCDKMFKSEGNLNQHMKIHGPPAICDVCGNMYTTQTNLNKHKRDKHQDPDFE